VSAFVDTNRVVGEVAVEAVANQQPVGPLALALIIGRHREATPQQLAT
jgi:hypothetical protein